MPSENTRRLLETSSRVYAENLKGSPEVLEYLQGARQITSPALVAFRVGYTGDNPELGDPARRISFPYITPSGVVQIRFRSLDPDPGEWKYLGVKGVPTTLYNTRILQSDHRRVYVTEGEMDCVTAWMCGLPAVGVPGSKAWKTHYWRAFRYREVIVLADSGEAGAKLAEVVSRDIDNCRVVTMPEDDVNHHYCKYGRKGVRELVGLGV